MKASLLGKTHLVIPDPHATPEASNDRFDWLGQMIVDRKPDVIVCLGDFADMPSLCPHHGQREAEGKRIQRDLEAVQDAQERLWRPLLQYNALRRAWKEKQYNPRRVMLGGNHDFDWVERAVEAHPSLEGFLSPTSFDYESWWDEVHDYKKPVVIDGIKYSHHLPAGVSGRPIGGMHMAHQLVQKHHQSCTVGHAHVLDYKAHPVVGTNRHMHGLAAGCYFTHRPSYAKHDAAEFWWGGVIEKFNVSHGDYDFLKLSIEEIERRYSG